MTHTPGPWIYSPTLIQTRSGLNVAAVYLDADGPLIAEAPNMLAVLREMAAYFSQYVEDYEEGEGPHETLARARAVIAKAEGRT